jgi:hypothetical protein
MYDLIKHPFRSFAAWLLAGDPSEGANSAEGRENGSGLSVGMYFGASSKCFWPRGKSEISRVDRIQGHGRVDACG